MKFRDLRRMLKDIGYTVVRRKGSHEQWKHPSRPGRVTVAGHDNDEANPKTLASIMAQIKAGEPR